MRRIRQEAKALGLSQSEYLRLTLALSAALRESLGETGIDTKTLLTFVESPMFSLLLGSIAKTAISSIQSDGAEKPADKSAVTVQPNSEDTQRRPVYPQMPHQPWHQMQQPGLHHGMQHLSPPNGQARPMPPQNPYPSQPLYPYGYPYRPQVTSSLGSAQPGHRIV